MKSLLLILIIFISFSSYGSANSIKALEDELRIAVQNDDSVTVGRLAKVPLLAESKYAIKVKAFAYEVGAFGFNIDKNLALELYLKAKSMGDRDSAFNAGILYRQEGNIFYDPKLGNQLIVESAIMGDEYAQRVAAICYLNSDCHNGLKFNDMDDWFSDEGVYFHPKANATLKAALSLPSIKNKLDSSYSILQTYSEIFEEDEDYNDKYSYLPARFASSISFEQFEFWLEVGIAEKHAKAALVLSAICYLDTGICNGKNRSKSLGELAVSWSPDLVDELFYIIEFVEPDDAQYDLYQAFGAQLSKAIGGDLESMLRLHYAFKKGVPNLSIAPNSKLADEWYSMVENSKPNAIFEQYRIKKRIISSTSDNTHFLAGGVKDSRIAETFLDIALQKEYPDALVVSAMEYLEQEKYDNAIPLIKRAAYRKHPHANYLLSIMYQNGYGVEKDMRESFRFAEKAAYQNHAKAQFKLAYKYATGEGSSQDYYRAYAWSNLAASKIDEAIKFRDEIAEVMTDEQVHQARIISSEIQVKINNQEKLNS